jgi:hypothetical protein
MKRFFYLWMMMLSAAVGVKGQDVINTDAPDQSDATYIVVKKHIQIESNLVFSKDEGMKRFDNVTLIRYGVTKRFELRLLNQYSVVRDDNKVSGLQPPALSFKYYLCKQNGPRPELTFVSYFRPPITISPNFRADHFGYTFTLAGMHDLTSKMQASANIGIIQDQQTTDISVLSTAELNYNFTDVFSTYIEYFGNYAFHADSSSGMDIGFVYAVKKNIALDLALGSPTMKPGTTNYISLGAAIRLPE